jgi:GntR family transcriptional regulator / MocR family aminotransferase
MTIDVFLDGVPLRRRSTELFDQFRSAIITGRLGSGDRLPTSRELAVELGIARSTVATVYSRLIAEGYAEARTGDGTFVAHHPATKRKSPTNAPNAIGIARPSAQPDIAVNTPLNGWRVDLRTGRPDPGLFPITAWRQSVTASLRLATATLRAYPNCALLWQPG